MTALVQRIGADTVQFEAAMNRAALVITHFAQRQRDAASAGDTLTGSAKLTGRGLLELSRGIEDAAVAFGSTGLRGAIVASSNNLTTFANIVGGPVAGALAGFAAAGVSIALPFLTTFGKAAVDTKDKLEDLIDSQIKAAQQMGEFRFKLGAESDVDKLSKQMSGLEEDAAGLNAAAAEAARKVQAQLNVLGKEQERLQTFTREWLVSDELRNRRPNIGARADWLSGIIAGGDLRQAEQDLLMLQEKRSEANKNVAENMEKQALIMERMRPLMDAELDRQEELDKVMTKRREEERAIWEETYGSRAGLSMSDRELVEKGTEEANAAANRIDADLNRQIDIAFERLEESNSRFSRMRMDRAVTAIQREMHTGGADGVVAPTADAGSRTAFELIQKALGRPQKSVEDAIKALTAKTQKSNDELTRIRQAIDANPVVLRLIDAQ